MSRDMFLYKIQHGIRPDKVEWEWPWGGQFGTVGEINSPLFNNLREYVRGKTVCLIGNAFSVFNQEHSIDTYDIVVRMNQTFPVGHESWLGDKIRSYQKYIGSKTNIYFSSDNKYTWDLKQKITTEYLVWCTYVLGPYTTPILRNGGQIKDFILYGQREWYDLHTALGERPGTGLITLYFLSKLIGTFSKIDIYGFDFWKTDDWIRPPVTDRIFDIKTHDMPAEERYIKKLISEDERITIVYD